MFRLQKQFLYFWAPCCAALFASSILWAQEAVDFSADEATYSESGNVLKATGDVRVSTEQRSIRADEITYKQDEKLISAEGNILYSDSNDISVFVDDIEATDDLSTAKLNNMRMRIGRNGPALTADYGYKPEPNLYVMENVVYSPCPACVDETPRRLQLAAAQQSAIPELEQPNYCPVGSMPPTTEDSVRLPWQLRAKEVTYNAESSRVVYKNAYLDVYGVPLAYLPYFSHAAGQTKGQSGLLAPKFGRSTNRGEELTLGYYYHQDPYTDYTFRGRYMTERGLLATGEHRRITKNFYTETRGSIIQDDLTDSTRSHAETQTEYLFEKGLRAGLNGKIASDQSYLDDFFNETSSYLPSTAYVEKADEDLYASLSATWFQDLRAEQPEEQTAHALPSATVEKLFYTDDEGGQLMFSSNVLSIHRTEGDRYRRFVNEISFSKPWIFESGQFIEASANARADMYHVENDNKTGFESRQLAQASLMWALPMTSSTGYHTITPKAMVVAAPRGGNPNDIPNEDSVAYELDTTNLFDTNRFAGVDRVESGVRAIYGVDNYWGTPYKDDYRLFVGQSYRFNEDSDLPEMSGARTKASDFVTLVSASPVNWFALYNRARFDNADFTTRRMDTSIRFGDDKGTNFTTHYTYLDGGAEELRLTGRYVLNEQLSFEAENRRDLSGDGRTLLSEVQAIYTHDCYQLSVAARRRGYENDTVEPGTEIMFNIELLSLGTEQN